MTNETPTTEPKTPSVAANDANPKFLVRVTETTFWHVTLRASTVEDAREQAEALWSDDHDRFQLGDSEIDSIEATPVDVLPPPAPDQAPVLPDSITIHWSIEDV